MLAYVFWHRPADDTPQYADALRAFHLALASRPSAGFVASRTARVGPLPWLGGGGYEDWYFVEDFTALGLLNDAAVDAAHLSEHAAVAHLNASGAGGLYKLIRGDWQADAAHEWSPTPFATPGPGSLWQRQMVLGPAPEYCFIAT